MIVLKKSLIAAVSGLAAALSLAVMCASGLFYGLTYAVPMLLGIIVFSIRKTFSLSAAWSVYAAVSILSLILAPEKEAVLFYILFFGWYPIIRPSLSKLRPAFISVIIKIVLYNTAVFLAELAAVCIFGIPFFEDGEFSAVMLAVFAVLMNILFLLYEMLLKYYTAFYEKKLEKQLLKIFKK